MRARHHQLTVRQHRQHSRPLRSATSEANLQRAGITGIRPNSAGGTVSWDALPRPRPRNADSQRDVLLEARDALGERRVDGPDVLTGLVGARAGVGPGHPHVPDLPRGALSERPQRVSVVGQLGCWTWPARNLTLSAEPGDDTARERPRRARLDEDGLAWMKRRLHSEWMGCRLPGSSFGCRKEGQGDEGCSGRGWRRRAGGRRKRYRLAGWPERIAMCRQVQAAGFCLPSLMAFRSSRTLVPGAASRR